MEIKNGKAFCEKCGREVVVTEKRGDVQKAELPYVLVDQSGHVLAERETKKEVWRNPE